MAFCDQDVVLRYLYQPFQPGNTWNEPKGLKVTSDIV